MIKRLLFILFIPIFSIGFCFAQEHLKFMGIPLDGTIDQFQAKLAQKGITIDYARNKHMDVGGRVFKGSFSGKDANIVVFYDERSKIVYRAKAVILTEDLGLSENNYSYFVEMLSAKYSNAKIEKFAQENHEGTKFSIPSNGKALYDTLGNIDVYRSIGSFIYFIHVDYFDMENSVKHELRNMDDL